MRILSSNKQTKRGAKNGFFRAVFLISLSALFTFAISCTQPKDPAQKPPAETKPQTAGSARVMQIDDAKIKELLKPRGKPRLVNFWATWCGPCREEFPDLVKIDQQYKGKLEFFTVSLDFVEELNTGVPNFLSEMKAEMPTYLLTSADENNLISSISKDWTGALPFTLLYNEKGEVTFSHQGKVEPEKLKSEIEKVLSVR